MRTAVRFEAVVAAAFAMHLSTAQAASERVVYSFCSQANCADGSAPVASLIDVNGTLYGTTTAGGGTGAYGTVFSIDPNTGAETVLHSFTNNPDGADPVAPLVNVGGVLYGTTSGGGAEYLGTVFSVDPNKGAETVLHSFGGAKDGTYPKAGLIAVKDKLYGTTQGGGAGQCEYGCGTVFSINLKTGRETVLYSFCSQTNCTDGADPDAPVLHAGSALYGTTIVGGTGSCYGSTCGTVFSLDITTGVETALYSFQPRPDGSEPVAGLANLKGTLYGTTWEGRPYNNQGTIFSVNPTTGDESVLYTFDKGGNPYAGLTRVGRTLYGATPSLVFAFEPATGSFHVLHHFCHNCGDGSVPLASVVAVNGTLYGTTVAGGASYTKGRCSGYTSAHGCGTVFAVQLQ